MARRHDGTNDNIAFGSDAGIDNFASRTIACWFNWGTSGVADIIVTKSANNTTSNFGTVTAAANTLQFRYSWSGASPAIWTGTLTIDSGDHHLVVTYSNSATSNVPVMWIDGVSDTVTTTTAASGTANSDAANTLRTGETDAAAGDLQGDIQFFSYDNTLWDSAMVNRHRWHGRKGGDVVVHHPFLTDKLTNEGTGTANGTATGTTVVSLARGSRPGCGVF